MRIINLEINEISPSLLKDYIRENSKSFLAYLMRKNLLEIYSTIANDVAKEKLYPSQTWASLNTGKKFEEHKCYWYSDSLNYKDLLWYELLEKRINIGLIGSLHSSKLSSYLNEYDNLKFFLPDCFSSKYQTLPNQYMEFQKFNNLLVEKSARVTNISSLILLTAKFLFKFLSNPKNFGFSRLSFFMILRLLVYSLNGNKENIRLAQFPLLASIHKDLLIKYKPQFSTLFSNHIAGNMHRYWYAYKPSDFKNEKKYSQNWIKKNKLAIPKGIDMLDDYIKNLFYTGILEQHIIIITSSMGQEANPQFDEKRLSNYDGKIKDINKFIKHLKDFQKIKYGLNLDYKVERNMAPQYGFDFSNYKNIDLSLIKKSIEEFVNNIGLKNKVDQELYSLVLTINPHQDFELQRKYNLNQVKNIYKKYGFLFFPIEDHHSGAHSQEGILGIINCDRKLHQIIQNKSDELGNLNYLKFKSIVLEYFE